MQHHPLAAGHRRAVAGRDPQRLAAALTDTVRLRALLPGGPVESHGRDAVVARFAGWFADFDTVELVSAAAEPVADRLLVHYRLDVRQGPTRWVCTQTAICKTAGDRLATVDLLCSGFREIDGSRGRRCVIRRSTRGASYDRDDPFPLFARVRAAGPVHEVTLPDGQRGLARRPPRRGPGRAERPAAVQGHARRARPRRRGGRRGPARPRVRPAHAQRRPARPHPAARGWPSPAFSRARVAALRPRVQADRRRPARRAAPPRRHRRRPGRGLRLPAAVHRDQRAARRSRNPTGPSSAGWFTHAAGPRLGARTAGRARSRPRRTSCAT